MTSQNNNRKKFLSTTALTLGLMALGVPAMAMDDFTTPTGEQVVGGAASFDRPAAGTLNVNQSTDRVVINWGSFNIGKSGKTEFFQPNAGSLAVNRVTGADNNPTQILGTLKGNGRIMVLDRNGIFFGADAVLDVGSIVASTGDVDNNAVMRGDSVLTLNNFGDGSVINNGLIRVADAGLAAFVAPHVANNGIIQARMGKVALAAGGESATVDLYGDGLVELAVGGAQGKALAENAGTIDAEGGTVLMSAAAAKGVVDDVINMNGVVKVSSVTQKGGKIVLSGGSAGKVKVDGGLNASGETGGGSISVTGQDIEAGADSFFLADAIASGNGGDVRLFAANNALFSGSVFSRGGSSGGNGGFVEISATNELGYDGLVSTLAVNGQAGSFLLDPTFAVIHSGSLHNPLGFLYVLSAQALANDLHRNGSVTVQATTSIDVGANSPLLGNGPIDMSHYDYNKLGVIGYFFGIPIYGMQHFSGVTAGLLTLDSNIVNFNKNLTLGTGDLSVKANTVNLNAKLFDLGGLLDQADITTTAGTVNVLSNAALIQQGIMLAKNDGATVNVGVGTYGESVLVNKNNVTLNGAASFGSHITPNSPGFKITANNVTVDGFSIMGPTGLDGYGVWVDNAANATVKNNLIQSTSKDGIYATGAAGLTLTGNQISNTGNDGIDVRNSAGAIISGNQIGTIAAFGPNNIHGDGIFADSSNGVVIKGNAISETATGAADTGSGIHVKNSNNAVIGGAGADRNTLTNIDWDGVKITGGDNVTVNNNLIQNVTRVGIYGGNTSNATIQNNVIVNGNTTLGGYGAISTDFGSDIDVSGNDIDGSAGSGIRVNQSGGTNLIGGNFIDGVSQNGIDAINTSGLTVSGNTIGATGAIGGNGIFIDPSNNALITANVITGAAQNGIYSLNNDNVTFTKNTITGSTLDGLLVVGGTKVTISGATLADANVITNSGDDGIDIDGTAGAVAVIYNKIDGTAFGLTGADGHNGIEISGTTGAVIDHNDVKNAGWDGINVQASTNAAVTWNVIDGTKGASGIGAVNGVNGLNVDRNTVTNSKQFGMYIGAIAGDLTITNNTVRGVTDSDGIYVTDNSASPVVTGNTVDAVGRDAISINDGSHAEVNGNWIGLGANHVVGGGDDSVIGRDGIRIVNADHSTSNGNKIANTAGNGIFVDPSPFSQINNNVITGFGLGANGIFLDEGDDSEIIGNTVTGNNGAGQTGIRVNNSDRVRVGHGTLPVNRNTVSNVGTGIAAVNGVDITLRNNSVNHTGNGITLDSITGISKVLGNKVENSSNNGIQVRNSKDVLVGDAGADVNIIKNTGWDGVNVQGGSNITVKNNTIKTVTGASGVAVLNSTDAIVTGNLIDDTDRLGVYAGNADNIRITDNIITDAGLENAGNYLSGIHVEASDTVTVTGNDVNRAKGDGINLGDGINWFDGTNTGTLIVSGNTVRNVARDGIHGTANIDQVNGNVVYKTGNDGIWLDGSHGVEVKNNKIGVNSSNATQGNNNVGGDGIQVNNSNNALISGNRVREAAFNGIFVDPSDDVEIASNNIAFSGTNGIYLLDGNRGNIHNNTVDESGQDGIKVDNNADVRVHDNNIDDSGDSGIEVWNSFNADIVDNSVTDSVGDGIALGNSAWAEIRGNNVTDSGDDGIDAEGSDDVVVNDNTVDESSFNGIEISGSNRAEIGGNTITRAGIDGINLEGGRAGWIHDNHILGTNGGFFTAGVAGAGRDGIHVENNRNVLIEDNLISSGNAGIFSIGGVGALENGIYVADSNRADILNNRIESGAPFFFFGSDSVGKSGIVLVRSARSLVNGNEIEDTGNNGIVVRNSAETEVSANALDDIGNHGIRILGSEDSLVSGNTLNDVAGHGIDLGPTGGNFSDGTRVQFNTLTDIGGDGIHAFDTYSLVVFDNDLLDIDGHGIYVDQGSSTVIEQNTIIAFGGDGIRINEDFGSAEITNNLIAFGRGDGIDVRNADRIEIYDNLIGFVADDGIDVSDSRIVDIRRNTVDFVLGNGIEVSGSNRVRIINNDVGLNGLIGENGIDVRGSNRVRIARNDIGTNVQENGIYVNPSNFVTIARNTIDGVGLNGIMLNGNDRVRLMSNVISNSGSRGLFVAGADNTYVFLADNTFTDNPMGAEFESGEIDMTGAKNTFNGGDVALRFAPVPVKGGFAPMNLTGNTIGETIFTGQSTYYIELANGAFFAPGSPTILDGFHATYDGFRPDTVPYLTQAQYDAIEAKLYHYNDLNSLGLFFFGMVPSINQEDIYKNFRGLGAGPGRFRITILGLPRLAGGGGAGNAVDFASFLANIAPAAGGEAQQDRTSTAQDLTVIEPAAGGTGNGGTASASEAACWSQAMAQASAGAAVSYSFGGSMEEAISQTAACGTGVSL